MKKPKEDYPRSDKFLDRCLLYSALLGLVTVISPNIALMFLYTFILAPIGFLLIFAPPLFCLLLPIRILKAFFPHIHYVVHSILIIGLFIAIPKVLNNPIDNRVSSLREMDNVATTKLSLPRSVALIEQNIGYSHT